MKKRFYSILAMSVACAAVANAQAIVEEDVTIEEAADDGDFAGETAVEIRNATVTMANAGLNYTGFAFKNGETVTLSDGGKVKFADDPEHAYASPEDYPDIDGGYFTDVSGDNVTAIPFNWIIDGTGNEIYLDSHCTLGGTIVGTGDVTIYVGNKDVINFNCLNTAVEATPQFTGTIYFKTLDGYSCDTLTFGSTYPGNSTDGLSYTKQSSQWAAIPYSMNVEGLNNPVLASDHAHSAWPRIDGKCSIYAGDNGFIFFRNSSAASYDAEIFSDNSASRYFEVYAGATIAFNEPVHGDWAYAYHRQGQLLLVNSQEPSFSGVVNRMSGRNSSSTYGGNGYIDCAVEGKDGSTVNVYPGASGSNSIGTLTIKSLFLMNNNGVAFDFDGQTSDKIVLVDSAEFTGQYTRVWMNLMENFLQNPKVGNYQVLDGKCVVGMQAVNDTVGYYVVDSVLNYVNVNTGDTITYYSKIFAGAENREKDTLGYWGPGTGEGDSYVSNPNKIDATTWALDYSSDARAAIEARAFMPYTNDTITYTGHNLTATDLPILYAYDYIYNFNLVVKNNEMNLLQPNGDTLNIARDFFNFTFKSTDDEGNTVMRYTTSKLNVAQANGDTVQYWFDFTKFFTDGVIALCSEEYPAVDLTQEPVNGSVSGIGTINKEVKAVAARTILSLDGKRLSTYAKGLNIVKTRYTDGTVEVKKVFFRE
jgi:hypothetical protein